MPDKNVSLLAKIINKTMDYHIRWRHVKTCCRLMCAYHAYVTIRRKLGVTCFGSRHFVNKVSEQHFSAENKQEVTAFYSKHLPLHFRGVIWKLKSKSNFPVSFNLISAEMNLVGNYRTLRGLRTVNPEGLPSTRPAQDLENPVRHRPGQIRSSPQPYPVDRVNIKPIDWGCY